MIWNHILLLTLDFFQKVVKKEKKNGRDSQLPDYCVVNEKTLHNNNIRWHVSFVLWAVVQPRDVMIFPKSNKAISTFRLRKKRKTLNIYAGPGWIRRREMLTETGTRIAKSTSLTLSGQQCRKRARGRVFPAVRQEEAGETRENLRMSACSYQVERAMEAETLECLTKSTISEKGWLSFLLLLVCFLTLLGTMCHSRKQWNGNIWRWSGPFSRGLSLTP